MAQAAPERATIDSLSSVLDRDDLPSALSLLARAHIRADSANKDPSLRIELGWALLRVGKLLHSPDTLLASADEFYHAIERARHWPYGWYGLGQADIALALLHARVRSSAHQPAGAAWIQTAGIAFSNALKADSTYRPAALALAEATLANNFDPQTTKAVALLKPLLGPNATDAEPFLLLGQLQRRLDSLPEALAAFRSYLRCGGDSGIGYLEMARTEFGLHDVAGAESLYYTGAAATRTTQALEEFREDLSNVADSSELRNFDSTAADHLPEWLRHFWGRRDDASGQRSGHRLAEHYRRWIYALRHFPSWARIQQHDFMNIYRTNSSPFDDRGAVYIRQGPPDRTATYIAPDIPPNESWLYFRPAGNLILHFAAGSTSGWRLIENLASIVPFDDPDPTPAFELLDSRSDLSPTYGRLAALARFEVGRQTLRSLASRVGIGWSHGALGSNAFDRQVASVDLGDEYAESRRSIQLATTTDADPLRFRRELQMVIQGYGAGGSEPETSRLLVVYALPDLRDVPYRTLPDSSVVYALRLRVQAADSFGHLALNTDSVRLIHAHRPLTKGQTLTGFAVLTVPPGEYHAKVMIADSADSVGDGWALADVPAPALDDSVLTLSDPILGHLGSGLAWARPDGTVPLNPLNTFSRGSTAVLSYEVGGLRPGVPYSTRIAVRKFGADSTHNVISIAFPATPRDTRELISKDLGLGNLAPGRYLLVVSVTDGSRTVERTRRIVVGR